MPEPPFKFEESLKELEEITRWFETTDIDLDQGLEKFERGMELAAKLKEHLTSVENRVEKIRAKFESPSNQSAAEPDLDPTDQSDLFTS